MPMYSQQEGSWSLRAIVTISLSFLQIAIAPLEKEMHHLQERRCMDFRLLYYMALYGLRTEQRIFVGTRRCLYSYSTSDDNLSPIDLHMC